MDKQLSLKLNGNRQVTGRLRGFDEFMVRADFGYDMSGRWVTCHEAWSVLLLCGVLGTTIDSSQVWLDVPGLDVPALSVAGCAVLTRCSPHSSFLEHRAGQLQGCWKR
eukprot:scaffold520_cov224-Pinguiococcus_pyrenoidosus.AAC.3